MKTIFLIALLLVTSPAFAEDTGLGNFHLTGKQIAQSESLKSDVIKGFTFWGDGKVVVTSTRALTQDEKNALVIGVSQLPDEDTQAVIDAKAKAEVDALIEAKKTAIAIAELKKEGKLDVSGKLVEAV